MDGRPQNVAREVREAERDATQSVNERQVELVEPVRERGGGPARPIAINLAGPVPSSTAARLLYDTLPSSTTSSASPSSRTNPARSPMTLPPCHADVVINLVLRGGEGGRSGPTPESGPPPTIVIYDVTGEVPHRSSRPSARFRTGCGLNRDTKRNVLTQV